MRKVTGADETAAQERKTRVVATCGALLVVTDAPPDFDDVEKKAAEERNERSIGWGWMRNEERR